MRTVDLFAGAGGAALGLREAGFESIACVEGDRYAVATLIAAGFPGVHAWIGPAPEGGPPQWQWDGTPVDLLWGSPPCQPYSLAGALLGANDPRDGWPATLDTIREIRPRWVIIENVVGSPAADWAAALEGMYPHVSYRTLDAADWGLPSHRRRVFIVAGPREYRWPSPTHYGPSTPFFCRIGKAPWVGFGDALGMDAVAMKDRGQGMTDRHGERPPMLSDGPMGTVRAGAHGGILLAPSACVVATDEKGHTNPHLERGRSNPVNRASDSLFLATGRRRLTWQECAILVGFPPDHPFQGGIEARYRQVGNAVAPVMAAALGRAVLESDR